MSNQYNNQSGEHHFQILHLQYQSSTVGFDSASTCEKPTRQSLLGMVNFCNRYVPNYSTLTEPIRRLTKKDTPFIWSDEQQSSLNTLKQKLTNAPTLTFYNPEADTKLYVDASLGLGAILAQKQKDNSYQPIAYGARSLTPTESRYSQTEREALAVLWSCQHFHYYIYDREVTIITDHKPLERLLTTTLNPPPRIQRWILKLQAYATNIRYEPGQNNPADYLSRHPTDTSSADHQKPDQFVNIVATDNAKTNFVNLETIAKETANDTLLQKNVSAIKTNKWSKDLKPYFAIRHQLSLHDNTLLKNQQLVIPPTLQNQILMTGHHAHQGITKTKNLLQQSVWWPSINTDIEQHIKQCHPCQVNTPSSTQHPPMTLTKTPGRNWQKLATDLKGPLPSGENILVVIDYKTKYPVTAILRKTTSEDIIYQLEKIFTMFGYPETIVSDNGPQFTSTIIENYFKSRSINHIKSSSSNLIETNH